MIRESTNAASVYAMVEVTSGTGMEFQHRIITGGGTTSTVFSGVTTPEWVRLVRSGNNFIAYYGADGTNWTQIGASQTISMATTNVLMGLAVTSHNNTTNCTANFDSVTVNQSPVLATISNQTVLAGQILIITNLASDADIPSQTLTFSLSNAPTNAAIDSNSGVFIWRPTIAQSPSTQTVSVVVTDGGVPPMSAAESFAVTVTQPAQPVFSGCSTTNGFFGFWINGNSGPDYAIQTSTNLSSWSVVAAESSPTLPFFWVDTNSTSSAYQFYRVVLGP
jgi:hypothetical protein